MPPDQVKPSDDLEPLRPDPVPELTAAGDPSLRLVSWLIRNKDFHQLFLRTGIRKKEGDAGSSGKKPTHVLPLLLELGAGQGGVQIAEELHDRFEVPLAYRAELKANSALMHVGARLALTDQLFEGSDAELVDLVKQARKLKAARLSLGVPGRPSREGWSLDDVGLPADRKYNSKVLTGENVVVGIIDDGCALAHNHFLKPRRAGAAPGSRILYFWDQAGAGNTAAGWTAPPDFYGLELDQAAIDKALNLPAHLDGELIREDKVYEHLGYKIDDVSSHGTHVMDIATGNGQTLMGSEGVACEADIIFVQLPAAAIESGAAGMTKYIMDGVQYIFARAEALGKPAVVNISYGGYDGPHDGTSELERGIDGLLSMPDRAVVIAAGNGFEARCHAAAKVVAGKKASLRWILRPEDPTPNDLEIWYSGASTLKVRLRSPNSTTTPAGWILLGQTQTPIFNAGDGRIVGQIEHLPGGTGNGDNRIVINLRPTESAASDPNNAPAPSGVWSVDIKNKGGADATVHAWIWRDDSGRPRDARRRQSRFHPDDASPAHTIAGWATGQRTISVGAFNTATQEVCGYSACGPTRPTGGNAGRPKPEVYAPAEEDVRGRGVLSASSLSARPTRMNGTSASAPHVAGLIALMFEYAKKYARGGPAILTADQISREIKAGTNPAQLKLDRHQSVDDRVKTKQAAVRGDLVGSGKIDFIKTITNLLP